MPTYEQTLQFLYSQLPMFQRQGAPAFKKDLGNTIALCKALGHPERRFKAIHIAGTNGKGSVSHLMASVLQSAGYKTGLYTSPHLYDFRERVKINGSPIGEDTVIDFVEKLRPTIEEIQPSFFELTVALAFDCFASAEVDIAVVETGLGGRLDSTNVLKPLLSVITNIGLDHQQFLGETLPEIAAEKAGIIKRETPVVLGADQPAIRHVFAEKAREMEAPIFNSWDLVRLVNVEQHWDALHFDIELEGIGIEECSCPLAAAYQLENLRTAISSLSKLPEDFSVKPEAIKEGIAGVKELTGFYGRWDILQKEPAVIVDGGHNLPGLTALFEQVEKVSRKQLRIVLGMVKDKELDKLLPLFETDATYYFTSPDVPRGLPVTELQAAAQRHGLNGAAYQSVREALHAALAAADKDDLILVCGSLFVAAEVPRELEALI